ncbi:MAG: ABC transporter substrate-binding protein [Candidatus Paceibacterota bacterium]
MKEKIKQTLNKRWEIPGAETVSKTFETFSISEKIFFYTICTIFVISGIFILGKVNDSLKMDVPANGGYLTEGIVGSPRFVNPVLAVSDVDKDLTSLIYSGLLRASANGELDLDLAKSYEVSENDLEYTFTLKDNIYFQDGKEITADDVEFTINKIQDSAIRSPKRPNFYDIKIEKINKNQIKFILKKPYSPFLENLTVGIMPKHIWDNLDTDQFALSQYNVEPIGSGPYKVTKMETLKKNMLLVPTYYELSPFGKGGINKPYIDKIIIRFYRDEKSVIDAYNKGEVEAINSISPDKMPDIKKQSASLVETTPLPRVFAVFFNQNQNEILSYKEVRTALNLAVDREKIVQEVLGGYGKALNSPIPKGLLGISNDIQSGLDLDKASSTLAKAGWIKNASTTIWEKKKDKKTTIELAISISTLNTPDLTKTAEIIKQDWEKLGAKVEIKQFELGDLQQNIIRPRKFDALLYGEVIGRDLDFYAFWHSSQRNDPGINVAMYTNSTVDKLLEDARKTQDVSSRIEKYKKFEAEVIKDVPAVFLYTPDFIYITPNKIKNNELGIITLPFERFINISNWYIETNKLWKIFQTK